MNVNTLFDSKARRALVTGGSGGIGLIIVARAHGWRA